MSTSASDPLLSLVPPLGLSSNGVKKFACGVVLLCEMFERLAFYSLLGTLVPYFQTQIDVKDVTVNSQQRSHSGVNWSLAVTAAFMFQAVAYILSVPAGWITDRRLGKFRGVLIYLIVYFLGYAIWTYASMCQQVDNHFKICPHQTSSNRTNNVSLFHNIAVYNKILMPISLFLVAVGVGGVKTSIAPLGADQVRRAGNRAMRSFFNFFYFSINVGSFIALAGVACLQQEVNYTYGYLIAVVALIISIVLLIIGRMCNTFIRKPPGGSPMGTVCRIFCEGCSRQCRRNSHAEMRQYGYGVVDTMDGNPTPSTCLDLAKVQFGGSFHETTVNDTKTLGKILLVFTVLLPYWISYFQMETTFVSQGVYMRLNGDCDHQLGPDGWPDSSQGNTTASNGFQVPVAWLSLFDVVILILLIPLFEQLIYPQLDKRGYSPSLAARIIVGMLFGIVALICAGFVEATRVGYFASNQTCHQTMSDKHFHVADMSIFWQIPQYMLIAVSELFTVIAGLELAYSAAPKYMHAIIMGFFLFSQGVGSLLGTASMQLFHKFFYSVSGVEHCFNCSLHLSCYFYSLAFLQLLGVFLFIPVSRKLDIGWRSPPASRNPTPPNRVRQVTSGHRFYNATDGQIHSSVIRQNPRTHVQSNLTRRGSTSVVSSSDEES